jgi:hypothetical protein
MIENIYYNRCRIRRIRIIAAEPEVTYECDSLPQPFEVFTPPLGRDFLDSGFEQFEWLVEFYAFGQPARTDLREKTVAFREEHAEVQPALVRGVGQIVATIVAADRPGGNEIVLDIGTKGPFYVLAPNRDINLKVGDWVELAPRHGGDNPDQPLMSVLAQAIHVIKTPKD